MNILVIDAQGGGIGRQLVAKLLERIPEADIVAAGTNRDVYKRQLMGRGIFLLLVAGQDNILLSYTQRSKELK